MNKTTKGALAAAAAAALLLGGAGTLAYWDDAAGIDGGTVTTGHLDLVPAGDGGSWTDITGGGSHRVSDIGSFRLVPGDTLRYSRDFTIEAEGDNLVADLTTAGLGAQGAEVAEWIDVDVTIDGAPAQITDAQDGQTVTVDAEVAFDPGAPGKGSGAGNAADDDTVDLSGLQIRLQQVQGAGNGN